MIRKMSKYTYKSGGNVSKNINLVEHVCASFSLQVLIDY